MENNKFTNFNYRLVNSTVDTHEVVEVTYLYNNKARRRFIFINKSPKTDYIKEAKNIVAKEIESGRFLKLSKRYGSRSHLGRNLLIATAATFGVTAVGLAGYTTYRHFAGAQEIQEVIVNDIVVDLKALNPSSSGDEIKKAREEFDKLSKEEQAQIPQEVYDNLVKQEELYKKDEDAVSNFEKKVETLNNQSPYSEFVETQRIMNALSLRATSMVKNATYTKYEDEAALYLKEEEVIEGLTAEVEKLDETTPLSTINELKGKLSQNITQRSDLLDVLGDFGESSNGKRSGLKGKCQSELEKAKEEDDFAKEYIAEVGVLKDDSKWDDIERLLYKQVRADLIKRSDLVDSIDSADKLLAAQKEKYDADKAAVTNLKACVDGFTAETCTAANLNQAKEYYDSAKEIQRPEFVSIIADAGTKIETCKTAYAADEVKVKTVEEEVATLKNNEFTCAGTDIETVKQHLSPIEEMSEKRDNDFKPRIDTMNETIDDVEEAYELDATAVTNFSVAAALLSEATGNEKAFDDVKQEMAVANDVITNKRTTDQELITLFNDASEHYTVQFNKFTDENETLTNYENKVKELSDKINSCTQEEITSVENIIKEFATERDAFKERLKKANEMLAAIQKAYDNDSGAFTELKGKVEILVQTIDTCIGEDIDKTTESLKAFIASCKRSDLSGKAQESLTILETEVSPAYKEDKDQVDILHNMVYALNYESTKQDFEDANAFLNSDAIKKAKNRKDLSDEIDSYEGTLKFTENQYKEEEDKITPTLQKVDQLEKDKLICSKDDIAAATEAVEKFVDALKFTELENKIKAAKTTIAEVHALYDLDEAKVKDLEELIDTLKDPNVSKEIIDEAKALLADINEGAALRTGDTSLQDRIKTCSDAVAAADTSYTTDETAALNIVKLIDNVYNPEKTEITQTEINGITTAYNNAKNQRIKSIADADAKEKGYGQDVLNAVSHIQLEYNIGKEVNDQIEGFVLYSGSFSEYYERIEFLSLQDALNKLDDYTIAPKAVTTQNRTKMAGYAALIDMETVHKAGLNGSCIDQSTKSTAYYKGYGYISEAKINSVVEGYSEVVKLDADTAKTIKEKYSYLAFYINVQLQLDDGDYLHYVIKNNSGTVIKDDTISPSTHINALTEIELTSTEIALINGGESISILFEKPANYEIINRVCAISYIIGNPATPEP